MEIVDLGTYKASLFDVSSIRSLKETDKHFLEETYLCEDKILVIDECIRTIVKQLAI